jgi:hypothetical protein
VTFQLCRARDISTWLQHLVLADSERPVAPREPMPVKPHQRNSILDVPPFQLCSRYWGIVEHDFNIGPSDRDISHYLVEVFYSLFRYFFLLESQI